MTAVVTETDTPTIELLDGMPGFPALRHFVLVRLDEANLLFALRSLEDSRVRFLVAPPAPFFPSYAPEIEDACAERLGLTDAEDALLLVVVSTGDRPEDATANLLAPIVINRRTAAAAQVVLPGADLPLQAPLRR